jgi:hypothetical protein
MKLILKPLFIIVFGLNIGIGFTQTKVEQSKEEIKKGKRTTSATGTSTTNHSSTASYARKSNSERSIGAAFANIVGQIFLYVTYYTVVGNYKMEKHLHSKLTKYPYYKQSSGNYENADTGITGKNKFRFDINNQFLYSNKDLLGNHLKVKVRPFQYFYLQVDYFELKEFNQATTKYDHLSLYNFNFCYDRLRFEKFNLGWSLGINYLANDVKKAGFSYGLNTAIFITKPVSLHGTIKGSWINRQPVHQFEVLAKYHTNRFFIAAGYERLKIATPQYHFLSLGAGVYL